jgi:ribonucleoside-triphosphate reductase
MHGMTHNVVLAASAVPDNKLERELMNLPSTRAQVITRRTYNRPTSDDGKEFETWAETVARVIDHQQWLWERAVGRDLNDTEYAELYDLEQLMLDRKVLMSGRTLWLGGTNVAKTREASQFNCSFTHVETIYDVVDVLWLLLQGCGVGFKPIVGTLNGFSKPIKNIRVVRSTRTAKGGNEHNTETFDAETKTWTIQVGDSAEAWAKSIGKLLAGKYPADTLVLDFSQLRPAGERLKGYGWISSGDSAISTAYTAIANILNGRADSLLTRMDILDIVNHLGTILSSRRSAEIALFDYDQPEWEEFAVAKKDWWLHNNAHRTQSNNSLVFKKKPLKSDLERIFGMMTEAGGSEPGFINEVEALRRAPWFKGANPCVEILLGNKAFCNLTETDIAKFKGDTAGLHNAIRLAARANYRQTCVNLQDGILQESWHLNNYFLRLCGVGLTGIAMRPDMGSYDYEYLKRTATSAAVGMSLELGLPAPKNVTCVKPSGTLSKIMDTTEGVHKPLGKYIFNNVQFSKHDPVVEKLRQAGYRVINHPVDDSGVLVTFPVMWDGVPFDKVDGKEVNLESAVVQLERYKLLQTSWNQQNTSVTISYDPSEIPAIIDWLLDNWDCYVGVSFIYRTDPTKTAKDLGYLYLPQEVVDEQTYREYVATVGEVDLNNTNSFDEITDAECATGACPIK